MSTDLKAIMTSQSRIVDICNDPDLDDDAKLFAICVIVMLYETKTGIRRSTRNWLQRVAELASHTDNASCWLRMVIRHDIPRYDCPTSGRGCTAPMIRREGLCGKNAIVSGVERDPITGEGTAYGFCTRHRNHTDDWRIHQNNKQWVANGRPSPQPNAGGILRRYFTADWPNLYTWAAPYMTPLGGAKPPTLPKPNLVLVRGELADD